MGHRQAFAWIDEWIKMDYADVKKYEIKLQQETNIILQQNESPPSIADNLALADEFDSASNSPAAITPTTPDQSTVKKGYFASWWS